MISGKHNFLFLIFIFISFNGFSAYLVNEPFQIIQPDGVKFQAFISGDEFYHWIHDENNFTIVKNDETGFFCYAFLENEELKPSSFIVGKSNPKQTDLKPGINISVEKILERRKQFDKLKQEKPVNNLKSILATGTINNIVIFIRFSNESEFTDLTTIYSDLFNNTSSGYNSLTNYYSEMSYNQLNISSSFYPTPSTNIVSYQSSNPRNYYQPYNSSTNPNGYTGGDLGSMRASRERALIQAAINSVSSQIPGSLNVDNDNDGFVDNICLIVSGSPDAFGNLLWPHMWTLSPYLAYINGKQVWDYNFQIRSNVISQGVGVLAHEMFHTFGAPDLYHYGTDGLNPVGSWDIMSSVMNPPQSSCSYLKYRYGNWISSIPEITTSGTYTLNSISTQTNNCYKIASLYSSTEYYIIEFRKQTGTFESSIPNEGLLISRINTIADGEGNADYPTFPDEVYVFRYNGLNPTTNGNINDATFSLDDSRTAFNNFSNPPCFLSNGSVGGINIYNISSVGTTMSFSVYLGNPVFEQTFQLNGVSNGMLACLDYNSDNYLDIITTGIDNQSTTTTKLYQNTGNGFVENTNTIFTGVRYSAVCNFDFNNDGNIDLLIAGQNSSNQASTKLYKNNGNETFTEITGLPFQNVYYATISSADFNNDGFADVLIAGNTGSTSVTKIYINNSGTSFTEFTGTTFTGVKYCSSSCSDYNKDGNIDFVICGYTGSSYISRLYKNNGNNTFSHQTSISLTGIDYCSVKFGDYDNNSYPDILFCGFNGTNLYTKVYKNNGNNSFTEQTAFTFTGVYNGSVDWCDYDNDGYSDILLTGTQSTNYYTKIYKNIAGTGFAEQEYILLKKLGNSCAEFADFDNDGKTDIVITGDNGSTKYALVYKNNLSSINNSPSIPANLSSSVSTQNVNLSWSNSTDSETSQNGLTYNLKIGTFPDSVNINSPLSNVNNGKRNIYECGNTYSRNSITIKNLADNFYFWSVQTIDNGFLASQFSEDKIFRIGAIQPPVSSWNYNITTNFHTIILPSSLQTSVNGQEISVGDYIGAFYDSSGVKKCGGFIQWNSTNVALPVFGETISGAGNGFSTNENFLIKIWSLDNQQEYEMNLVIYNENFPDSGFFTNNGLSEILSLGNSVTQIITFPSGWSMFSTYVNPLNSEIENIFSGIVQNVNIIKDENGNSYWPQYSVNLIGNLTIGKGYQINMTSNSTLGISGILLIPQNTPISIPFGWSLIGYIRQNPGAVEAMVNSILSQIIILKDENGNVFWPQYSVNNIINLNAGKAYQLKSSNQTTLYYPSE